MALLNLDQLLRISLIFNAFFDVLLWRKLSQSALFLMHRSVEARYVGGM